MKFDKKLKNGLNQDISEMRESEQKSWVKKARIGPKHTHTDGDTDSSHTRVAHTATQAATRP